MYDMSLTVTDLTESLVLFPIDKISLRFGWLQKWTQKEDTRT
jgi:hypothetical protein